MKFKSLNSIYILFVFCFSSIMAYSPALCANIKIKTTASSFKQSARNILPENIAQISYYTKQTDKKDINQEKPTLKKQKANPLYYDQEDYKVGPDHAKVKIIEFFDYNCGYCKISSNWVYDIIKKCPNDVQIIFKELPILEQKTHSSKLAAKAALSAGKQGKYYPFHLALMKHKGKITKAFLEKTAHELDLNLELFLKEMENPELTAYLDRTFEIAKKLEVSGTPFFKINSRTVKGANIQMLNSFLNMELDQQDKSN